MASLDNLPADQRAVLQLVLQRGRTYDEIAQLLSIDRAAVRERALAAFDALGPQSSIPPERRALVTDYLLGQLPTRVAGDTRERLAQSAGERAWARVIASELAPLATSGLPEIPVEAGQAPAYEEAPVSAPQPTGEPERVPAAAAAARTAPATEAPRDYARPQPERGGGGRPTSRRGGAVLLILGALIVVAVIVVLLVSGSSSNKKKTAVRTSSAARTSTSASTPASTGTSPKVVAQINLVPPAGGSKAAGIAEVLRQGNTTGLAIVAQNIPPNKTSPPNAYAVWLYNSPGDSVRLGFVNPGVGSNGRLSAASGLPKNASHFKQLLVTLETHGDPKAPGKIVLEGALTGVS